MKSKIIFAVLAVIAANMAAAQAATPSDPETLYYGATIRCASSKGALGAPAIDCHLTSAPGAPSVSLKTTELHVSCDGSTLADVTACKGTGRAELQSKLGGFPPGFRIRIALDCVSPASAGPMQCKEVMESGQARNK
ncbi:MAG: hypothetical protein J0I24_14570 [Thiomonas arsenitoxydans]|uniref:Uncharacterized protein n=1 Tax=Thiomonas arsenitoxydans (strain DSM 22701 / CIP 110005 / 3As) TaxID=426114 RepID=A0A8I1SYI1_THIA3|nr:MULTISPECIES: hypothetical protein [Thiomonas]MBN8745506.1 hypothetical protein [Thiomonas arsenitoxydans]ODU96306.1 MAG: hypothetical protein ABT24_09580 [Thiomonas sp. SCN 64-16]